MGRRPDPIPTQDDPTRPPETDVAGRPVDAWGLPYNGPSRVAALTEVGKRDPNLFPEDWAAAPKSADTTEA